MEFTNLGTANFFAACDDVAAVALFFAQIGGIALGRVA